MERIASCSCGQLKVTCSAEPVRVSMCHCLACQKRTGSPFGAQARFEESSVKIEGTSTQWSRVGDSGGTAIFHFCPTCGATVFWRFPAMPGYVAVTTGAFADPTFPPPMFSVYEARRHSWVHVPETVEHMD